jgi:transposase
MTIIRIGLDTAKHVFQVHGVDENEQTVVRRQLRRSKMGKFFNRLAPTRIGLEALVPRIIGRGCCADSGTR